MPDENPPATPVAETQQEPWTLFTDGSSCVDGSGAWLVLTNPEAIEFTYTLRFQFATSNNEAEYEALIAGLRIAAQMGVQNVHAVVPYAVVKMCWTAPGGGIDIAGPFLEGPGKVKFLIVTMDYFTKWIEANAMATITGGQVKKFVWDNIVCRFGLSGEIVSDNGKQFSDNPFKYWCDKPNITQRFASVKHPQSNRLVERANRSLGEGIKVRLGEGNKNWVKELPHVFWAHRIMIKSSHGDTPFSLTYGTKAVILAEIRMPTLGDFVYRSNDASHAVAGGKLGPKWEGPYERPNIPIEGLLHKRVATLAAADSESLTNVYPRRWVCKELDLSNLGEAPSSDISVCVAASANRITKPCGATIATDTGTPSDLA
uniref:Reverse transcriptase domain-containing protein n=1 Tax=Tanacetum cinerariifolium TaxID=118510 RepID=A0A6L2L5J7_TANCI|nr:reverse transcriptase domain-containing protein [Tanacetum cinerariifolium]